MNIDEKYYCSRCMKEIEQEGICPYCGYDPAEKTDPQALEEGTLLHECRYQLGTVIGRGGFGITYSAWDQLLNQPVAIKEYFPLNLCGRNSQEDDEVQPAPEHEGLYQKGALRFIREARILGTLQNMKNVVPVLDWFSENNTQYIVMKFIRGVTLAEYVKANKTEPQELINMSRDLIDSLIQIHEQGILHRDISPSNIMVEEDGTFVLIDFGAAISKDRRVQGQDKTTIHNRSFSPIEQYDENGKQGPWTDVYGLSATLYYLICGEAPMESIARSGEGKKKSLREWSRYFQRQQNQSEHKEQNIANLKSPRQRGFRLRKWQDRAIMEGLAVQPEDRIQNMKIFRSVLYHLPMPEEVQRRQRFMRRVIAVFVSAFILTILIGINCIWGYTLRDGIRYTLGFDGYHVRGYSGGETLTIPEKQLGINIVGIREEAFQNEKELKYVSVPGTVDTVSPYAFSNCENLTTVTLNEGVRELGEQAFSGCESLQAVRIPATVDTIAADTFKGSEGRLVLLGETDSPAAEIANEYNLNYAAVQTETAEDGIRILKYETEQKSVHVPDFLDGKAVTEIGSGIAGEPVFPREVNAVLLPAYLKRIGDFAFYQVHVKEISLPETLESIGFAGFAESHLQSLSLPESVRYVGENAFSSCTALISAALSPNMTEIPVSCFEGAMRLEEVTIPKGITEIKMLAFARCEHLERIKIPAGVETIGDMAFMENVALEQIYLPSSLKSMNYSVFDGCSQNLIIAGQANSFAHNFAMKYGYEFVDMSEWDKSFGVSSAGSLMILNEDGISEAEKTELPAYFNEKSVTKVYGMSSLKSKEVILRGSAEIVDHSAFYGNQYLESVSAPETLKEIGAYAFAYCENLSRVELREGLEEIQGCAFLSCKNLRDIQLPDSLTLIQDGAFQKCENLTSIEIPSSMSLLDNDVFSYTGLTSVRIPGNITKCRSSFYGCKNLKTAELEEGVRTLWGTFAECSALETVILPSTITQVSRSTFQHCGNLKDVWIYSDDAELDYVFKGVQHSDYAGIRDGNVIVNESVRMEENNDVPLFGDSPNLTIHAHRNSTAHTYALEHGIAFDEIPDEKGHGEGGVLPAVSEKDREMILHEENPTRYWYHFRIALGNGYMNLASAYLDVLENSENIIYRAAAHSARLFFSQSDRHGYETGAACLFFEDSFEHPILQSGDIIVEINGQLIKTEEDFNQLQGAGEYTILRENDHGMLEKLAVTVNTADPTAYTWNLAPYYLDGRD